jgi:ribonuclease HII
LTLSLVPRADGDDGAVALASIVSKALREHWMDAFNAHWKARIPDLKSTAGYPVDAARFRRAIEPVCQARGLTLADWWRAR